MLCLAGISSAYARQGAALISAATPEHDLRHIRPSSSTSTRITRCNTIATCGGGAFLRLKLTDRSVSPHLFLIYMSCRSGTPKAYVYEASRRSTFLKWKNSPSPHSSGTELRTLRTLRLAPRDRSTGYALKDAHLRYRDWVSNSVNLRNSALASMLHLHRYVRFRSNFFQSLVCPS